MSKKTAPREKKILVPGDCEFNRREMMQWEDVLRVKTPDPSVRRDPPPGYLLDYLVPLESLTWGRWAYWTQMQAIPKLPQEPIPGIEFLDFPEPRAMKMLSACLDCIPNNGAGGWQGWSSSTYVEYFLRWCLYGFGHAGHRDRPVEPAGCEGAFDRLYQVFNMGHLLLWPYDYFGDIFAEMRYGKHSGFYPTPMTVGKMMTLMTMGAFGEEEIRDKTVLDPCVGTGRFPLLASNYSLRLYAMDILEIMVLATLVNGYLYAPWLVRPIGWLDPRPSDLEGISDSMAAQAPPHMQDFLQGSVHDRAQQWKYAPIIKRTRGDGEPPEGYRDYKPLINIPK